MFHQTLLWLDLHTITKYSFSVNYNQSNNYSRDYIRHKNQLQLIMSIHCYRHRHIQTIDFLSITEQKLWGACTTDNIWHMWNVMHCTLTHHFSIFWINQYSLFKNAIKNYLNVEYSVFTIKENFFNNDSNIKSPVNAGPAIWTLSQQWPFYKGSKQGS